MLSVLSFKKGLFAGVLDGGEANINMGGTRLTKFMESVEATTTAVPSVSPTEREEAVEAKREFAGKPDVPARVAEPAADPWQALLQAGTALLQRVRTSTAGGADSLVRKDERTGETYLRLPVPSPDVLNDVLGVLGRLLEGRGKT